jgi:archaellum biogenesis ATPase FlaH
MTTIENQKLMFKYIIKNNLINQYPDYLFTEDSIFKTFGYVREYYNQYNSIPTIDNIYIKTDISKKILEILFDLEQLDNINKDWLVDFLNDYNKKTVANHMISILIDNARNEKWDLLYEDLRIENYIISNIEEDFKYEGKSQKEIYDYHKKLSMLNIKKVAHNLSDQLNLNEKYKTMKYLLYPLIKEGQLGMFFGATGDGKTVLAVEFANMIAKGKCEWEGWYCETEQQNVCYIDFELGGASFASRYKQGKFSPNLKIHNVNVNQYNNYIGWNNTQSQRIDRAIDFIEEMANISESKIIFIDNLSNIADQVEQAKEADRFISDLYGRMKALGLTIIFLGHTPKINADSKLSINMLKGSSSLTKTFESIVGFKRSIYKNISYIKQLKHRDIDLIYDEDNVGKFEFNTNKYGYNMDYIGSGSEEDLFEKKYINNDNARKYDNEVICDILYDKYENKLIIKDIAEKYSLSERTIKEFNKYYNEDRYELKNYYEEYKKRLSGGIF